MSKPRFKKAAQAAALTLISHNIKKLPVNPFDIIAQHNNWKSMTYKEYALLNNFHTDEDVIFQFGSIDGCAFYDTDNDRYLIIYNDDLFWIKSPQRITWTLTHEIGHIVLGHLRETPEAMITRAVLGEEKYQQFEAEAEYFAANVLAPTPVLYRLKISTVEEIIDLCGISRAAALNKLKHLRQRGKRFFDDFLIDRQFSDFVIAKIEAAMAAEDDVPF